MDNDSFLTNSSVDRVAEESFLLRNEKFFMSINLTAIICNALTIFTILKFKEIQSKTNLFILNWTVTDLLFLIFNSSMYNLFSALHKSLIIYSVFCIFSQIEYTMLSVQAALVIMLNSDFIYDRLSIRSYKATVLGCWVVFFLLVLVSGIYCYKTLYDGFPIMLHVITFCILLLAVCSQWFVLIRDIFKRRLVTVNLRLALTTSYVFSWTVSWACLVVDIFSETNLLAKEMFYIAYFGNIFGYSNGILKLGIMLKVDVNFRRALVCLLRCKRKGEIFGGGGKVVSADDGERIV